MRPSRDASGTYGPSTSRSSAPTTGDVDGVRDETTVESRDDLFRDDHSGPVLRLARRGCEVWCDDDVVELEQRPGVRLFAEHVERRAGHLARPKRLEQRVLVEQRATRRVDDSHAGTHRGERVGPDRAPRLGGQREVQGDEVRGGIRGLRRLDGFHAKLTEAIVRDVRVVGDDPHPEPKRAPRDLLADSAEAEHAERLVGELDAAVRAPLPAALLQRGMRLRDVARERDEEADRVLRGGDDRRLGRVRDDDPTARRGVDVDVVDAHARAPDHLQPLRALDQVGGQLRRGADDDRVVAADDLLERALGVDVHVEARAEKLDARRPRSPRGPVRAGSRARRCVARAAERLERRGHSDAALDVGAEVGEDELHRPRSGS